MDSGLLQLINLILLVLLWFRCSAAALQRSLVVLGRELAEIKNTNQEILEKLKGVEYEVAGLSEKIDEQSEGSDWRRDDETP